MSPEPASPTCRAGGGPIARLTRQSSDSLQLPAEAVTDAGAPMRLRTPTVTEELVHRPGGSSSSLLSKPCVSKGP